MVLSPAGRPQSGRVSILLHEIYIQTGCPNYVLIFSGFLFLYSRSPPDKFIAEVCSVLLRCESGQIRTALTGLGNVEGTSNIILDQIQHFVRRQAFYKKVYFGNGGSFLHKCITILQDLWGPGLYFVNFSVILAFSSLWQNISAYIPHKIRIYSKCTPILLWQFVIGKPSPSLS